MKTQVRFVPDCSVIQLEDGRIGWKSVNTAATNRNVILSATGLGIELPPQGRGTVLKFPAMLVKEYVEGLIPEKEENLTQEE